MSHSDRPDMAQGASRATRWLDSAWLLGISAVLLLTLLPFSSYIASVPFIRQEWDMSNTQAALVFSAYLAGYAVSSIVLIPMTDRVSPAKVLLAGVTVGVVSSVLFALFAHNIWTGAALRLLAGAGHVAAYVPGIRMVSARFAGGRRGTAVAVFVSAGYGGTTLSYVFMGQLLAHTPSWRIAYLITALAGIAGIGLALLLARVKVSRGTDAGETAGGQPQTALPQAALKERSGRLSLSVLREPSVALVNVGYALHTAELYLARLWLPLLLGAALVRTGTEPEEAAALAATLSGLMFMMGIAGSFLGGAVSDYLGRAGSAAIIFAVSGACSFVIGWLVEWPALIIGIGFIYGFFTAADSAIYSTAVTELSPRERIGSAQAVQSFMGFTAGAIAPVAAGSILDIAKSSAGWGLAFSFNGALAVIGVLALLWLRRLPKAAQLAAGKR